MSPKCLESEVPGSEVSGSRITIDNNLLSALLSGSWSPFCSQIADYKVGIVS